VGTTDLWKWTHRRWIGQGKIERVGVAGSRQQCHEEKKSDGQNDLSAIHDRFFSPPLLPSVARPTTRGIATRLPQPCFRLSTRASARQSKSAATAGGGRILTLFLDLGRLSARSSVGEVAQQSQASEACGDEKQAAESGFAFGRGGTGDIGRRSGVDAEAVGEEVAAPGGPPRGDFPPSATGGWRRSRDGI